MSEPEIELGDLVQQLHDIRVQLQQLAERISKLEAEFESAKQR
jgi:hypothetical protein